MPPKFIEIFSIYEILLLILLKVGEVYAISSEYKAMEVHDHKIHDQDEPVELQAHDGNEDDENKYVSRAVMAKINASAERENVLYRLLEI